MVLLFPNGDPFATGALRYDYRPATEIETTNRIIFEVEIQGIPTTAVVDTGAPYVICAPKVASDAGVDPVLVRERVRSRFGSLGEMGSSLPALTLFTSVSFESLQLKI